MLRGRTDTKGLERTRLAVPTGTSVHDTGVCVTEGISVFTVCVSEILENPLLCLEEKSSRNHEEVLLFQDQDNRAMGQNTSQKLSPWL